MLEGRYSRGRILLAGPLLVLAITLFCNRSASGGEAEKASECLVSAAELNQRPERLALLVVDSRPANEFRRVRIPGSVNLELRTIRTKPYLKQRPLLLVDHAYHRRDLEAMCHTLHAAGFANVAVFAGGIEAWDDATAPLSGERLAQDAFHLVSPAEFERGARRGDWLIIDTSDTPAHDFDPAVAVTHLPLQPEAESFHPRLTRALAEAVDGSLPIMVDADGTRYPEIQRAIGAQNTPGLYYLAGGLAAYRKFKLEQQAMLSGPAQPSCRECKR